MDSNPKKTADVIELDDDKRGVPDPELVPKPTRRKFTAAFKTRTLREIDELRGTGQIGAYLREHGLYAAQISKWRSALRAGGPEALEPKRRGRPPKSDDERSRDAELARLRRRTAELERKLAQTEAIVEVQKKLAAYIETTLGPEGSA